MSCAPQARSREARRSTDENSRSNGPAAKGKRSIDALRASEERLRLALEATGTGIFLWHVDTNEIETNAQFLRLCDIPPDVRSVTAAMRDRIHPDDRLRYDKSWGRALDASGTGAF